MSQFVPLSLRLTYTDATLGAVVPYQTLAKDSEQEVRVSRLVIGTENKQVQFCRSSRAVLYAYCSLPLPRHQLT